MESLLWKSKKGHVEIRERKRLLPWVEEWWGQKRFYRVCCLEGKVVRFSAIGLGSQL